MTTAPGGLGGGRIVPLPAEQARQSTARVGMIIFLGSWGMMFGALFFSLALLRLGAPEWPPAGTPALPLLLPFLATLAMALSEVALHRHGRLLEAGTSGSAPWLGATLVLGLAFLGLQIATWSELHVAGLDWRGSTYGSVFYLLNTFHALHVAVGLALLLWLLPAALRRAHETRHHSRLGLVAMFWHFVGAVWLVTFLALYVI